MTTNLFVSFLRLLGVKHTSSFSTQYFAEHPHKYNLLGLSSMLSHYKINNVVIKVSDKNDINRIETPFIAHTSSDFAIVEKIYKNRINFTEGDKKNKTTTDEFLKIWTGYTLIAEVDEDSIEPNFKVNFQKELFHNISKISALVISAFLIILGFIHYNSYKSLAVMFLLIISLVGVYICYLLILKQLKVQSNYTDKLCSLFKYIDCNNTLESKAAKLFGIIGWSEIGFGCFIANIITVSFITSLLPSLLIINIFSYLHFQQTYGT